MNEIKELVDADKIFFGARETVKNLEKVSRIFVCSDCRQETRQMLEKNNFEIEFVEFSKQELAEKLGLEFKCEAFGVKK